MKILKEDLINPPKKYRPLPFWSWNAELKEEETLFQVEQMDSAGMGGYFMHARGGLKTEYMGDEWMKNVRAAISEGEKRGMAPWGYDENGWPSGFGSGAVNGLGEDYVQKYIHMEITDEPAFTERTVANKETPDGKNMHFYYSVNRFYIDAMDGKVTDAFIKSTHEKYKEELGEDFSKMAGFFTDEPQLSRKEKAIPWSFILPEEYEKEYGENLLEVLDRLFVQREDSCKVRFRFWHLVTRLFSENYMKRIYDWCNKNGTRLTGHMVLEESFAQQLDSNGSCMPSYMYMHIPGVDKLGRSVFRDLLAPQVTSVCAQTGKKQILTESYALCGWDVTFEDLKWILEWQMVKGVNLLCQHLAGYSLGGIRKRDYPAGHFYQNFWWDDYKAFNDFASRMGMLLSEGEIRCETLVIHTISSGWLCRCDDHDWQSEVDKKYSSALTDMIEALDKNQIVHHLGDETVMEKLGSVKGGKIRVGEMEYSVVIVPPSLNLSSSTYKLLKEFKAGGGTLIFQGDVPEYIDGEKTDLIEKLADVRCDSADSVISLLPENVSEISLSSPDKAVCDVQYAPRYFEDFTMHYFVNTYSCRETAIFEAKGESLVRFDYLTGEIVPYPFKKENGKVRAEITLEEKGSIVLFTYDKSIFAPFELSKKELVPLNDKLKGEWEIVSADKNALTLDYCDVTFDGEKTLKNFHVTDIEEIANSYERKVNIRMDFKIKSEIDPAGECFLVMEEPEHYDLFINGKAEEKKEKGYFRDKSFIKLDISGKIRKGENKITLITDFVQPDHIYETIKDCYEFESMKNKLWYDREIEEIYLLGDFSVKSESPFVSVGDGSCKTAGGFVLASPVKTVTDGDTVRQGFPFHCGKMTLSKSITLDSSETENRFLEFKRLGGVITKVTVNGKKAKDILWAPYRVDLSGLLKAGENTFEIELISNFRNLLGPLHRGCEQYEVAPGNFYKQSEIFGAWGDDEWTDEYAFLEKGLFLG